MTYHDEDPRFYVSDADCEDVALHDALDRFGAPSTHEGGETMAALDRLAVLPREAQECIIADIYGDEDDVPRWTGGNVEPAPAAWFVGWGENAMGAV